MNKNFENMKQDYMSLNASQQFKERIEKEMRKQRVRYITKQVSSIAAVFLIGGIITLQFCPSFVNAVADVPVLGSVVNVLTFGRYEVQDNGAEAKVVTPKIEGLLDKELQDKLNRELQENADAVIAGFEQDLKEIRAEYPNETVHFGVESDYTIRTDNADILALDVYFYQAVGSSSTTHKFYTVDKKTGALLTLKGLFKDGADYSTPISEYIKGEMRRMNKTQDGLFFIDQEAGFENFTKIQPDQNFYINDSGDLVICFDKYEVAAGAQGCPEFEIPQEVVKDILK